MSALCTWCRYLLEFLLGVAGFYSLYYLLMVVRKPKIHSHRCSVLAELLREECPIFTSRYWPPPWAFGGHFTTILRSEKQENAPVTYRREVVTLRDGGRVALDWTIADFATNEFTPILLILPGLTGSSSWNYVTHLANDGQVMRYRSAVMNQRGVSNIHMGTPKTYCATSTDDLQDVVDHIVKCFPQAPIVGVGVSIGGVILARYLFEYGVNSHLSCVITLCAPWDMLAVSDALNKFPSKQLYNKYLCENMKDIILSHSGEFEPNEMPIQVGSRTFEEIETLQDFDRLVTIQFHGYSSCDEYYRDGSNSDKVPHIKVPLISINTEDDPFIPSWSLPVKNFQKNPYTVLIMVHKGGHIGFLEGMSPNKPSWMDRALKQCLDMLRRHSWTIEPAHHASV